MQIYDLVLRKYKGNNSKYNRTNKDQRKTECQRSKIYISLNRFLMCATKKRKKENGKKTSFKIAKNIIKCLRMKYSRPIQKKQQFLDNILKWNPWINGDALDVSEQEDAILKILNSLSI